MEKTKIGILIFTDKVKERSLSDRSFDDKKYFGLKSIVSELCLSKYEIKYVSSATINECDFVLVPIISYYDAMSYIKEVLFLKITTKLIVGGPYVINYNTFQNAYAIVLGRCEEMIEDIFNHVEFDNVIYPDTLKSNYKIGAVKRFLCIGNRDEVAVGCKAKCFFCQYAWKNKYVSILKTGYNSNYSDFEDYIQNLNAYKNGRYVTAIDGLSEKSRYIVNKRIKDVDILNKLSEIAENDIAGLLKIYNIVAYPWEKHPDFEKIIEIVKNADVSHNRNKLTIYLTHTHFIPKLLTPLEDFKVNAIDARSAIIKTPILFKGKYFKLANNISITGPNAAFEEYIIDRADIESDLILIKNVLCSNKYQNLDSKTKTKVIEKYFEKFVNGYKGKYLLDYTHNIDGAKKRIQNMLK